jgi:hypothetical protein
MDCNNVMGFRQMIMKHSDDIVDQLMVAYEFDRCDVCKDAADEIERLRGLLIRIGKRRRALAKLVCGEWVPFGTNEALDAIERCVREALGDE